MAASSPFSLSCRLRGSTKAVIDRIVCYRSILAWIICGLCLAAGLSSLLAAAASESSAANTTAIASDSWPQFRGPRGDGHANATALPLTWNENQNVAWKTAVPGRGWSSPVLFGEQIWMTTALETLATEEQKKRLLADNKYEATLALATSVSLRAICVHRETGKLLHNVEVVQVDSPEPVHKHNSYATPTPVVERGRVYCDFGTYGTAVLDSATGDVLWHRRLPIEHQVGAGSSPLLVDQLLVLVRDGCDVQYVTALDKRTGKDIWKTDRPAIDLDSEFRKGFSTPLLIEQDGHRQLVVPGAKWVVSYEPATGQPIWRANYVKGYSNIARPVFGHGMVYVCTNGPGQQLWAIRINGQGDVTDTHVTWKVKRQTPNRVSPLLAANEIYVITDKGVVTCLDTMTGQKHWSQRVGGNHAASPVFADGHVYVFSEEGETSVFQPGKQSQLVAKNHLQGRFVASPAMMGKAIYLRSDTHLYRIEKR